MNLILAYADLVMPAGSGCETCTLGHDGFNAMIEDGVSLQRADRLRRFAVVVAIKDSMIVTVFPLTRTPSRRLRRRRAARRRS